MPLATAHQSMGLTMLSVMDAGVGPASVALRICEKS